MNVPPSSVPPFSVEVLAVGDELLIGDIVNGNAAWIGAQLTAAGLAVTGSAVVGDDIGRIAGAVREALDRADALIITGGLGPTQDDLTREGLAAVAGVALHRDPELERRLRERFAAVRRDVPDMNFRQADVPAGAAPLPNPRGSAPGLRMELADGVVYALPGVPREMQAMVEQTVLPDLLARVDRPVAIVARTLRTAGVWESEVAQLLAPEVERCAETGNPTIAFLAGGGQVRVRILATAATTDEARALVAPVEQFARARLGEAVYGVDDDTLDGVVHRLLAARSATVAVAESLTGGLLGAALTAMPGSSATFRGGITAYATDAKAGVLGVPAEILDRHGAVATETAEAMAAAARERLGATYGLALTGVAGPGEQEGNPPGTLHIGLAGPAGVRSWSTRLPGDREWVRQLAVIAALDRLRRHLTAEFAD